MNIRSHASSAGVLLLLFYDMMIYLGFKCAVLDLRIVCIGRRAVITQINDSEDLLSVKIPITHSESRGDDPLEL